MFVSIDFLWDIVVITHSIALPIIFITSNTKSGIIITERVFISSKGI